MDLKEFRRVGAKRVKAEKDAAEAAAELRPLAVEALRAGIRPIDVCTITGWSPAQVRIIARAAGLPAARRGRVEISI